jgi:hypothetical protein
MLRSEVHKFIVRTVTATVIDQGQLSRYSNGLRAGRLGFDYRQGQEIILYSTVSRLALDTTYASYPMSTGVALTGMMKSGREFNHLRPSSAEVKYCEPIFQLPHISSWRGAWLIEQREKFTFIPLSLGSPVRTAAFQLYFCAWCVKRNKMSVARGIPKMMRPIIKAIRPAWLLHTMTAVCHRNRS